MKTLLLIDTHALIHRFFHALPPLTTPQGEPINAVYGLANVLLKIFKEQKPDYLAAAFDRPEKTFREEAFQDYKINRPPAVPELITQFKLVREIFNVFQIKIIELAGYEADDLIGSAVEKFKSEVDLRIVILSGDLDLLQLVEGERVVVQFLKKGLSATFLYDEEAVWKRYNLQPAQLTDLKGLLGDVSDNIPGVKGVGPKTAIPLLRQYGNLERLYDNLWEIPHKTSQKLEMQKKIAFFSKDLATIKRDAPLAVESLGELAIKPLDEKAMKDCFQKFGFTSLIGKL